MMTIHCPGCRVRLTVPADAGGRAARCPSCQIKFRVPDPSTMLDETVAAWMELDQPDAVGGDEDPTDPSPADQPHDTSETRTSHAQSDGTDETDADADCDTPARETAIGATDSQVTEVADHNVPADTSSTKQQHGTSDAGQSGRRRGDSFVAGRPTAQATHPNGKSKASASDAPTSARLQVRHVGSFGVRLAFCSKLLELPAFRASLPMRCILTGETNPAELIARPLPWLDKATGHLADPRELEARYECPVHHQRTPRQVVKQMPTILELPGPFNAPMPYYVARHLHSRTGTIYCETLAGATGVQCEVVIPDIRYALDWLGRVNGVCGEDYEQLEQQAVKFEAEAWQAIPETVRNRLAVWFDFEGDESFLGYFNDADFCRNDAGLAGLILTDHRLVFTKYHHHGTLSLQSGGELTGTPEGTFVQLTYLSPNGGCRKLTRLRHEDATDVARLLADLEPRFRITLPETDRAETQAVPS